MQLFILKVTFTTKINSVSFLYMGMLNYKRPKQRQIKEIPVTG
jgi:hypothetical protein